MGTTPPERTPDRAGAEPDSSEPGKGLAPRPVAGEDDAEASTGDPSLEALRALDAELAPYFPAPFDETELVLMDVDPRRVHAYWHVASADLAEDAGAAAPLVVRVYDVTDAAGGGPGSEFFDVDVQGLEGRCYVDLWQAGRAYEAELALRGPDGALRALARSNQVRTPPDRDDISGVVVAPGPLEPAAPPAAPVSDGEQRSGGGEPALSEPPAGMAPDFPNPAPEPGRVEEPAAAGQAEAVVEGAVLPPNPQAEAPGPEGPGAAGWAGTPDAPLVTLSSSTLAGGPVVLEVHAELHVFGRAQPGSRLQIFGRPVALRPDGSFSVRRPLPAGAVVVPLELEEPAPVEAGPVAGP